MLTFSESRPATVHNPVNDPHGGPPLPDADKPLDTAREECGELTGIS